jgi:dienelactone hydrolase
VVVPVELKGPSVAKCVVERRLLAPDVIRTEVRERDLVGVLFRPSATGPHPAIVTVGGSTGGLRHSLQWAAFLAARGYMSLALAYFNYEQFPPVLHNAPLEYFDRAFDWLPSQEVVRSDKLAIMGISRGAEHALLLGPRSPGSRRRSGTSTAV